MIKLNHDEHPIFGYMVSVTVGALLTTVVLMLCLALGPGLPGHPTISVGFSSPAIMSLRLTRVAAAAIVGAALALSGVLLQGLLRNPLADPYVLGISSGGAVGVMAWIVISSTFGAAILANPWLAQLFRYGQTLPALCGSLLACTVVYFLGQRKGQIDPLTLLLAGVVLGAICGGLIMLLQNLVPYGAKANLLSYLFGYISEGTPTLVLWIGLVVLLAGWAMALNLGGALNIAALSDVEAVSLGVRLGRMRMLAFFCASFLTAGSIALAGPIGFVGLICPHICRMIFGPEHRRLMLIAPFVGAIFLMLADTFVRITGSWFGGELPVGVVTALCGGPFFLYLLSRRRVWE